MKVPFPIHVLAPCPFGLQNIPFGIFSTEENLGRGTQRRAGVAIANFVLELHVLFEHGLFSTVLTEQLGYIFLGPDLNAFAALPSSDRSTVRQIIIKNLTTKASPLFTNELLNEKAFVPQDRVKMHMPMAVSGFSDFFSSHTHAKNCADLIGGSVPAAFYEHPMAYNGRVSSVAISGTNVIRPKGFWKQDDTERPVYQTTRRLDFEVEIGVFISAPVEPGKVASARNAADHVFGYVLLNDWSARDIQSHEMAPFGPFHSKSFLTSISPWVVTLDALRGSHCPMATSHSTPIHSMLQCDQISHGLFDIRLSAYLSRKGVENKRIVETKFADSYWDSFQIIAYQSSSGCGLRTGDLLGTGTISSPRSDDSIASDNGNVSTFGCLVEMNCYDDLLLEVAGERLAWLEDGDTLSIEGWFKTSDGENAGFGTVTGSILGRFD